MTQQSFHTATSLQKYLRGVDYPANKDGLRRAAEENHARSAVLKVIDQLPADHFDGPTAVIEAFGELQWGI